MPFRDDEDVPASHSSSERLTRADQGRRERLKREIREQKGREVAENDAKKLKELKMQVNLRELQSQVAGGRGEVAKGTPEEVKKRETFTTKTLKQEEESQVETAQVKPTPEKLIRKEELAQEKERQAPQEYQQDVG